MYWYKLKSHKSSNEILCYNTRLKKSILPPLQECEHEEDDDEQHAEADDEGQDDGVLALQLGDLGEAGEDGALFAAVDGPGAVGRLPAEAVALPPEQLALPVAAGLRVVGLVDADVLGGVRVPLDDLE